MLLDRQIQFATQLQKAIDEVEVSEAIRFLKALPVDKTAADAKYFLAMDVIRHLGNVELTIDQLKEVAKLLAVLVGPMAANPAAVLPEYPGALACNIFHVLAYYTQENSQNAEAFFTAVRNVLASRANLKAAAFGLTPLHIAAECNNRPIAEFIVLRDESQLSIETSEGLTASEVAQQAGNTSIAKFLKDREMSLLRKKQLNKAISEVPPKSPSSAELSGVETMLQLLAGGSKRVPPSDPRLAVVEPVDKDSLAISNFIHKEFPKEATMYLEFLARMGLMRIDRFESAIKTSGLAAKFQLFLAKP